MAIVARFETVFRKADIHFGIYVVGFYFCLVDQVICQARSRERTGVWFPAVAVFVGRRRGWFQNLIAVPPDNAGHVFHAAVADLDTSPVEDLFEFVRFRKVSVEESEENLSNVGANTLTKRRVEPNDFTRSLSSLLVSPACGTVAGVLHGLVEATCF